MSVTVNIFKSALKKPLTAAGVPGKAYILMLVIFKSTLNYWVLIR